MTTVGKNDNAAEKAYAEAVSAKTVDAPSTMPVAAKAATSVKAAAKAPVGADKNASAAKTTAKPATTKARPAARKTAPVKKVTDPAKAKPAVKRAAKGKVSIEKIAKARKTSPRKSAAKKSTSKSVAAQAVATSKSTTTNIKTLKEKIMATAPTQNVQDTMKSTAEEMQARFQSAFGKSSEFASEYSEFAKGNVEAIVELGKLFAAGMQDMGREAMEESRSAFETMSEDVRTLAAATSPTEMLQLQGELARKYFDQAISQGSKTSEKLMKLANEAFVPVSSRVSVAVEKVSKAA